jgi:ribonucleoside-triphosphate reductase
MTNLGGNSKAPKHITSYCGSFINLVFAISSQFAGAVATVEFLMYFDYFARKDYGDNYLATHEKEIANHLQHVVYAINQPAASRGFQSSFWNISIFDKPYFNAIFGDFCFPCGDRPKYDSVNALQKHFMEWFNNERTKSLLTFPVVTAACLSDGEKPVDEAFAQFIASEGSKGNGFFIYMSDSADSLSSCCRLKNELIEKPEFSYSLGAGGVSTGSINVMTLNMNRLYYSYKAQSEKTWTEFISKEVEKLHKYQKAYRAIIEDFLRADMLPVYSAGYISLDKQFLTVGINGLTEAAEQAGVKVGNNDEYIEFLQNTLKPIYDANRAASGKNIRFNTECVPAENLGVKNAKWDSLDGIPRNRSCYNSYFYLVEDKDTNILDKMTLHGEKVVKYLDGGSALHLNLLRYPSAEGYYQLLVLMAKTGCNYLGTNVLVSKCKDCNVIDKNTVHICSTCGSKNISYATRVIGYLKEIESFSTERQLEAGFRFYK